MSQTEKLEPQKGQIWEHIYGTALLEIGAPSLIRDRVRVRILKETGPVIFDCMWIDQLHHNWRLSQPNSNSSTS